jgi:endonuclease VIII
MPEGDTIFRTATTMRKWVDGATVTAARTKVPGLDITRLVGKQIEAVESRAKHLLIRFSNGLVLHTHMRMTGSWHLYSKGERWRKPEHQAKVMIECGERVIVCFNAPVVEMLLPSEERSHRSIQGLGPDLLGGEMDDFDYDEVRRRADSGDGATPIGEVLLDQRVVGGIGNIYRCETLFMEKVNPWTEYRQLGPGQFERMIRTAMRLLRVNSGAGGDRGRLFDSGGPDKPWVYGRTGRSCRICHTQVKEARMGRLARDVYWCPQCQAGK